LEATILEKHELEPTPRGDRTYEAPTVTDLGAVDKFSQGDTRVSIDDQ
jgi:hypothetical protein